MHGKTDSDDFFFVEGLRVYVCVYIAEYILCNTKPNK